MNRVRALDRRRFHCNTRSGHGSRRSRRNEPSRFDARSDRRRAVPYRARSRAECPRLRLRPDNNSRPRIRGIHRVARPNSGLVGSARREDLARSPRSSSRRRMKPTRNSHHDYDADHSPVKHFIARHLWSIRRQSVLLAAWQRRRRTRKLQERHLRDPFASRAITLCRDDAAAALPAWRCS
jgi:hypothetical protein